MKIGEFQLGQSPIELSNTHGQPVDLRKNSLAVLEVLASKPYQLVSREELLDRIWPDSTASDEGLSQCIRDIRRVINDNDKNIIQTVYKRGYRLIPDSDDFIPPPEIDYGEAIPYRNIPDFTQSTGFTRASDGVGIAYASTGSGPVIVRAPHWLCHLDWDLRCGFGGPRIQRLSERLRFIRFDSRGTGRSDRNVDPGGVDEWCQDMHAVASATGHKKFALMGISGGAPTCVQFAVDYPELVSCVVLLGGFARGQLMRGKSIEEIAAMAKLIKTGWGTNNDSIRQIMTTQLYPNATPDLVASFNHLQQVSCDGATAAKISVNIARIDVTRILEQVSQPTLIIHSKHDFRQPMEEAELLAASIQNSRLLVLETRNHTPMAHEPEFDIVNQEIADFVVAHSE